MDEEGRRGTWSVASVIMGEGSVISLVLIKDHSGTSGACDFQFEKPTLKCGKL